MHAARALGRPPPSLTFEKEPQQCVSAKDALRAFCAKRARVTARAAALLFLMLRGTRTAVRFSPRFCRLLIEALRRVARSLRRRSEQPPACAIRRQAILVCREAPRKIRARCPLMRRHSILKISGARGAATYGKIIHAMSTSDASAMMMPAMIPRDAPRMLCAIAVYARAAAARKRCMSRLRYSPPSSRSPLLFSGFCHPDANHAGKSADIRNAMRCGSFHTRKDAVGCLFSR